MIKPWPFDSQPGTVFPAWTRGNAADVFPEPVSPLMRTFYLGPALGAGLRDAYIEMGAYDWDELENPEAPDLFRCFGGYLYNPLSMTRLLGARMPGATPEAIDKAFFDDRADVPPYVAEPWHTSPRHEAKLAETMGWAMSTPSLPELDRDKELADRIRAERPDLTTLDVAALLARARAMLPYLRQMFDTGMTVSSLGSLGPGALGAICEGIGDPSLSIRLLAGIDADSADPPRAMWQLSRLARTSQELTAAFAEGVEGLDERLRAATSADAMAFVAEFDSFLFSYGSRGANEWDVISKSWEVRPQAALAAIDRMRVADDGQAPVRRHAESVVERDRVAADVRAKIAGDPETAGLFEAALRSAQLFLSGRERYKSSCVKVVHEVRMCVRELGERMVAKGVIPELDHIFMLAANELDEFQSQPERFTERLADRWLQYRSLFDLEPVFVVDGTPPPLDQWPLRKDAALIPHSASGAVLTGKSGSGGVATGRARIILDPSDPTDLEPGDVLVAPQTDPAWAPLFVPAAAVIVNVGALGSHAMIVSRELGIPCVVSVENATLRIPDGAIVTVDGNNGTVTIH
jgi:rifampicin phosphotransferase